MGSVTVTGRAGVQASLDRVVTRVEAGLRDVVQESSEAVRDDIRQGVPFDQGGLYDGVEIHYAPDGLSADIGFDDPDLYYADFVENGTSAQPAQPFMRPAAVNEERELPQRVTRAVQRGVR